MATAAPTVSVRVTFNVTREQLVAWLAWRHERNRSPQNDRREMLKRLREDLVRSRERQGLPAAGEFAVMLAEDSINKLFPELTDG